MEDQEYQRVETTFKMDFDIADMFGVSAIQDTYNRAFAEWKTSYKYLTELVMVLNHKIGEWYEKEGETSQKAILYNKIWGEADEWACNNLKGKELKFFYHVTD